MEGDSSMSKKRGEGLKSFNKGFTVPDTYIIIFFVVVIAAVMTFLVPKGYYETQDITYMMNGVEKTRTVIKDGSFQYLTDEAASHCSAETEERGFSTTCTMELSTVLQWRSSRFF